MNLDELERVVKAANPPALMGGTREAAFFIATFDPPTALALIARIRELEAGLREIKAAIWMHKTEDAAHWSAARATALLAGDSTND